MEKFPNASEKTEKIKKYLEKYIPDGLKTQKKVNLVISAGLEYLYAREAEITGLENLPEKGPFIIVSNHFDVKETEILLATLKNYDAHIVAAEKVHGEHPIRKIGLNMIRAITAPETLANLSEEEKETLIERVPDDFVKEKYQEIIKAESAGEVDSSGLLKFIRSSVALLSRGDVLIIYPEGLWLYDGEDQTRRSKSLYKGYGGFEVIANQYEKLTGERLPVIPTAVFVDENGEKKVKIGKSLEREEIQVDVCMSKIAEMLPSSQQGHYADKKF